MIQIIYNNSLPYMVTIEYGSMVKLKIFITIISLFSLLENCQICNLDLLSQIFTIINVK